MNIVPHNGSIDIAPAESSILPKPRNQPGIADLQRITKFADFAREK